MKRTGWLTKAFFLGVMIVSVLAFGSLLKAATRQSKVVSAEQFQLVDPKTGKVSARLMLLPSGEPGLMMNDQYGRARVGIMLNNDGNPVLSLYDKEHNSRASLSLSGEGIPLLLLSDANRKKQIHATLGPDKGGCPWLGITDKDGKTVWGAP